METKSRYEVISDLETKKRELIREKNDIGDTIKEKERGVKQLERKREDLSVHEKDFELKQKNAKDKIMKEKEDFDFTIGNTKVMIEREITDAKEDLEYFKTTTEKKKETIQELIKSVDESLERFKGSQEKK